MSNPVSPESSVDPAPQQLKPSFWSLAADEPYRIFFPLGVLVGISGVSLWPLFFSGIHHSFYPGVMHARMMIEGFLGAFIFGFLGTAVPRLTGARSFSRRELRAVLALFVLAVGTHIAERYLAADIIFLVLLLTFAGLLFRRFRQRSDLPPPSFVLVGFGYLNAILGTGLLIASGWGVGLPYSVLLGNALLYQGFVLYLVLGIGSFLLPRILQLPEPEFPEMRTPTREWIGKAVVAGLVGTLLLASFVIEAFTVWARTATFLRFAVAAVYLFTHVPFFVGAGEKREEAAVTEEDEEMKKKTKRVSGNTILQCVKLSLLLLVLGLAFPVSWPAQRVAGLHLVFIGGFTLLTFAIATRVVLGHSGQSHRFRARLPVLAGAAVLLLISAVLRVTGDFTLATRGSLLSHASYIWMLAAAIWAWRILPWVRKVDAEK